MSDSLIFQFISWYFVRFPVAAFETGENFLVWAWRFFSIGYFIPRLFAPWHRDLTSYGVGFDFAVWGRAFLWNLISRLVGLVARVLFIILGLGVELFFGVAFLILMIAWYALPLIIVLLLEEGIKGL